MLRTGSTLALLAVMLLGQTAALAGEPGVPDTALASSSETKTSASPKAEPRAYLVAVRIVSAKESATPPKKPRAPQVTRVVDRAPSPVTCVKGWGVTFKGSGLSFFSESTEVEVTASSTAQDDQVLLDLTADKEETHRSTPLEIPSTRSTSFKTHVVENVRLGEKTVIDFSGRKLEVTVTAAD